MPTFLGRPHASSPEALDPSPILREWGTRRQSPQTPLRADQSTARYRKKYAPPTKYNLGIDRISRLRASVALIFDDHKVFLTILRRRFDPFLTRFLEKPNQLSPF